MSYEWLTYSAAGCYFLLGLIMLIRLVRRMREQSLSDMTVQSKFGLVVFLVLLIYCALRVIFLCIQAGGVFSSSALNVTANFVTAIPATMFLVLQTTLLFKWNLHVSDVTEVLRQDRFRVGGTLIYSSIGLSLACVIIAIIGACDLKSEKMFTGTEWNILLQLFFGVAYCFNGLSFLGLGIYLRWLWTPTSAKARRASHRILGIAVIFGLCCALRGGVICYYIKPRIDKAEGKTLPEKDQAASEYAQTIIYILEVVCLAISLVALTSQDSSSSSGGSSSNNNNNTNSNNKTASSFRGHSGRDQQGGINNGEDSGSEYRGATSSGLAGGGRAGGRNGKATRNLDGTDDFCIVDFADDDSGGVHTNLVPARFIISSLDPRITAGGDVGAYAPVNVNNNGNNNSYRLSHSELQRQSSHIGGVGGGGNVINNHYSSRSHNNNSPSTLNSSQRNHQNAHHHNHHGGSLNDMTTNSSVSPPRSDVGSSNHNGGNNTIIHQSSNHNNNMNNFANSVGGNGNSYRGSVGGGSSRYDIVKQTYLQQKQQQAQQQQQQQQPTKVGHITMMNNNSSVNNRTASGAPGQNQQQQQLSSSAAAGRPVAFANGGHTSAHQQQYASSPAAMAMMVENNSVAGYSEFGSSMGTVRSVVTNATTIATTNDDDRSSQ